MNLRRNALLSAAIFFTLPLFAQSPKLERTASLPEGLPRDRTVILEDKGYRVTLNDGWTAELWLAKGLKLGDNGGSEALYPELSNGEFVGVLHLPKGMTDFRGQTVTAGTYTLRYQLLPQDANHLGVSPNPDFLLATPAASDTKPDAAYSYDKLVALSAKSTGAHPAVIALDKAGEPGTVSTNEESMLILTVSTTAASKPLKLGIVLKGQAAQ